MNLMNCCCQPCAPSVLVSLTTISPGGVAYVYYTDFDETYKATGLLRGFSYTKARWRLRETGFSVTHDGFGSTKSSGMFNSNFGLVLNGTYPSSASGNAGMMLDAGVYKFFTIYPYSGFLEFQIGCISGGVLTWPS